MDRGAWWAIVHGVTESDMSDSYHNKNKEAKKKLYFKNYNTPMKEIQY